MYLEEGTSDLEKFSEQRESQELTNVSYVLQLHPIIVIYIWRQWMDIHFYMVIN